MIQKQDLYLGTLEEIREYLEKDLNIQPAEARKTTNCAIQTQRFYPNENQSFEKQTEDKTGYTLLWYLEIEPSSTKFSEMIDDNGNKYTIPHFTIKLEKVNVFIRDNKVNIV